MSEKRSMKQHTGSSPYYTLSSLFHENTKLHRMETNKDVNESRRSFPFYEDILEDIHFKTYPRFKQMELPRVFFSRWPSMREKSGRKEISEKQPLSIETIAEILYHSGGLRRDTEGSWENSYRCYPSVGARYPLEVYLIVPKGFELEEGIYHYNVKFHTLELIVQGDFVEKIGNYVSDSESVAKASLVILITAIFRRSEIRFGDRGYRYVLLEAGHLAQNFYSVATSMSLNCIFIGEFLDDELNRMLDLDGTQESVIYVVAIGGKRQRLIERVSSLLGLR